MIHKGSFPLLSATGFHVPVTSIADGAGAYDTPIYAPSGQWIAGNTIQGRDIVVIVQEGALTGTPTGLKVGLYKGTANDGTGAALVTGTDTEYATPAGNTTHRVEIAASKFSGKATDFYSLGLSCNGAGTTAVIASATAHYLDPSHA